MNIFKTLFAPSGEKVELTALQTWTVSWYSRNGPYHTDVNKEYEVFIHEHEANLFANQLREAYKLLKHTSCNGVTVTKN